MGKFCRKKFLWTEKFQKVLTYKILETYFESMLVEVHNGNLKLNLTIIITQFKKEVLLTVL